MNDATFQLMETLKSMVEKLFVTTNDHYSAAKIGRDYGIENSVTDKDMRNNIGIPIRDIKMLVDKIEYELERQSVPPAL